MSLKKSSRKRSYTKDQIIAHQLTKWISSVLGQSDKELTTTMIYNDIKTIYKEKLKNYYPDKPQDNGSIKKGLNRNTVLDHLNAMKDHGFVNKKIASRNTAFWSKTSELPLEPYVAEVDKNLIDLNSREIKTYDEYNVNLYGFPNEKSHIRLGNNVKNYYQNMILDGIKKIKFGMNKIQQARFQIYQLYKTHLLQKLIIENKSSPLLDRRIFAILIYYVSRGFPFFFKENADVFIYYLKTGDSTLMRKLTPWLTFEKGGRFIITSPDNYLVKILQSSFDEYRSIKKGDMLLMLQGYKLDENLSLIFHRIAIEMSISEESNPLVAVSRSEGISDFFISQDISRKVKEGTKSLKINYNNLIKKISNFDKQESFRIFLKKESQKIKLEKDDICQFCGKKIQFPHNEKEFLQINMKWLEK